MIKDQLRSIYHLIKSKSSNAPGTISRQCLTFCCNICGTQCKTPLQQISREVADCPTCHSTPRMRSMISLLSESLFGKTLALPDFPTRTDLRGIGMSDWDGYALPLAHKLNYTNTYYHQEPRLDITHPPKEMEGALDFVLSTDVFEHVTGPIQRAFDNTRKLLKPKGTFVFSVPYTLEPNTIEHFPELYDFEILQQSEKYVLKNKTRNGELQTFENLVFHGGPGSTLEMRVFSEKALIKHLEQAGFTNIQIRKEPNLNCGVYWSQLWSLPITAQVN